MKHEADGLYSFSYARAVELSACYLARIKWRYTHGDATVPITFAVMLAQERRAPGSASWCVYRMYVSERITYEEYKDAHMGLRRTEGLPYVDKPSALVGVLMNTLARRARREGRLK